MELAFALQLYSAVHQKSTYVALKGRVNQSNILSIINLITQTAWCLHVLLVGTACCFSGWLGEQKTHWKQGGHGPSTACPKDLAKGDDLSWQHTPEVPKLLVPEPKHQVSSTGTWWGLNRYVTCPQPHQANRNSTSFLKAPQTNAAGQPGNSLHSQLGPKQCPRLALHHGMAQQRAGVKTCLKVFSRTPHWQSVEDIPADRQTSAVRPNDFIHS